jgi:hypothetical protein
VPASIWNETQIACEDLRLISEAQGLENAGDHSVPRPVQQKSTGRQTPIEHSLEQMPRWPPCPVCRMRFGMPKRSFPNQVAAQRLCERQKDSGLVVYACPAGAGFHLGHLPNTRPATVGHPAPTPQRREPHRVDAHVAPMLSKFNQWEEMYAVSTFTGDFGQ